MTDAGLDRLRGWFQAVRDIDDGGKRCPQAERLAESAAGRLSVAEQEAVVLHLADCGACAASWRLARELLVEVEFTRASVGAPSRSRWIGLAAAAAAVTAIGVFLMQRPGEREVTSPVFREAAAVELKAAVDPDLPLPRDRLVLRWSGAPAGTVYDLRVTSERLEPLYRVFELDVPEQLVPAEAVGGLEPGSVILWSVSARLPEGRHLPPVTFRATVE